MTSLCFCCLHVMSTWKQNSKDFEDSMVRDIIEGIDYRMKLEGMDTEVLKELEQVLVLACCHNLRYFIDACKVFLGMEKKYSNT